MSEHSPFNAQPDRELGSALRDALTLPHGGAFVARVRARLGQRQAGWEDEVGRWFWQGLVAATVVIALAGWSLAQSPTTDSAETASMAGELLDGTQPGANVILASLSRVDNP